MEKKLFFIIFIFSSFQFIFAQENAYLAIYPDSLKESANAIIKENLVIIDIPSFDKMNIKKRRVITVYNEEGMQNMDALEYFDKSTSIKSIEAIIYNAFGKEIKKIKRKDFKENSVSQGSIITDNRVLYLDYTPIEYPFTLVFESETTSSNTAFIPSWYPISSYFISTVNATLKINYADGVKLKFKEFNSDDRVKKVVGNNFISFSADNLVANKYEQMSPSFTKFSPYVLFGLEEFKIEGYRGQASDWNTFGQWMYTNLLSDTEEIPVATIQKIKELVGKEKNDIEIAKIIYKYVQDKTRYVSVQLGIGGWRPMLAKDVDRLGYGDCKALTNYTRSLLKTFNIPSYYTVVYGDKNKRSINEDFVSLQGNHVILGIPKDKEIIWLECTSQTQPFGFQGDFTDDRKVLIVSEEKSEIVSTKSFNNETNEQKTTGKVKFSDEGAIFFELNISSKGIEFDEKYFLDKETSENKTKYYKNRFSQLNNLIIKKSELQIDKENIELTEILQLTASEFLKKNEERIILPINLLNQVSFIPQKYKQRNNPFEIERGYQYVDQLEIAIPKGYKVDAMNKGNELTSKFGSYKSSLNEENGKLLFARTFVLKKGYYSKTEYNSYRDFREQIAKFENLKIVLTKI